MSFSLIDSEITLKYLLTFILYLNTLYLLNNIGNVIEIIIVISKNPIAAPKGTISNGLSFWLNSIILSTDPKKPSRLISIKNLINVEKNN